MKKKSQKKKKKTPYHTLTIYFPPGEFSYNHKPAFFSNFGAFISNFGFPIQLDETIQLHRFFEIKNHKKSFPLLILVIKSSLV